MTGTVTAPVPPGRLGEAAGAAELGAYVTALRSWVGARGRELDGLDAAALGASAPDAYTADVTLAMTLWQSVRERTETLERLWDGGRVDQVLRDRMTQVIWGRLSPSGGGDAGSALSLSLVEACRLCDALAGQLRTALSFDPSASDAVRRVGALRAAMERLRELVKQEPSWSAQVELLGTRIDDVATRAARGGDVTGALADLETDAARAERDLVVTTATALRRARSARAAAEALAGDRRRTEAELDQLRERGRTLRELAERCRTEIADAPRYAVPDVDALGPLPEDRDAFDAYTRRLGAVVRAFGVVEQAYGGALAELEELRDTYAGYATMAARLPSTPTLHLARQFADAALGQRPCELEQVRAAVVAFRDVVRAAVAAAARSSATASLAPAPTAGLSPSTPSPSSTPGATP